MRFNLRSTALYFGIFFISLSGCSSSGLNPFPGVYKIDIQQGNVITQEMVDQLKPGMTRNQVQFVMGTPLVSDTFHQNRWDYFYSYKPGGKDRDQKIISLYFEDERLARLEGDLVPASAELVN